MLPTHRFVALALVPMVFAILYVFDGAMLWPMVVADVVCVALGLVDAAFDRTVGVTVNLPEPPVLSLRRSHSLSIALHNHLARTRSLTIGVELPEAVRTDDLPLTVELGGHESRKANFIVEALRRGRFTIGPVYVRWPSRLGLWQHQRRLDARAELSIYPDVQAVREYELLARSDSRQTAGRLDKRRGGETEFEQLRDYSKDDEFRAIDWRATARRGNLVARQYRLETDQCIVFVLDAGRLMRTSVGGISLFDHALNSALMLAHVATRHGDKVAVVAYADRVLSSTPLTAGKRAVEAIVRAANPVQPVPVESDHRTAIEHVERVFRRRALIVHLTALLDDRAAAELVTLTKSASRRHLHLLAPLRDVDVDALVAYDSGHPSDVFIRGAAAQTLRWRASSLAAISRAGALVLDTAPAELTPTLITKYLEVKAKRQL